MSFRHLGLGVLKEQLALDDKSNRLVVVAKSGAVTAPLKDVRDHSAFRSLTLSWELDDVADGLVMVYFRERDKVVVTVLRAVFCVV